MHIDKERECARLVWDLIKAGSNLAQACRDSERAALIWNKHRYLKSTNQLLDDLIHTLQCKHQMDDAA